MTSDQLFWLAVYWDDFLSRYGVQVYMEVRYGLGEHNYPAELRMSGFTAVDR